MNKDLIKQQLDAFSGWLKSSKDIADVQIEIADVKDEFVEVQLNTSLSEAYQECINIFSLVKDNIMKLMEDNNEN